MPAVGRGGGRGLGTGGTRAVGVGKEFAELDPRVQPGAVGRSGVTLP